MLHKRLKSILSFVVICSLLTVTACNRSTPPNNSGEKTGEASSTSKVNDPLGKYDPPIKITLSRVLTSLNYPQGESVENNIWYNSFKNDLGITVENNFITASGDAYEQKLGIMMASNDLPDILMTTKIETLVSMAKSDLLADMKPLLESYGSDYVKKGFASVPESMDFVTINGKLVSIPWIKAYDPSLPWVRTDWMKKLNLQNPKTLDDIVNIARTFVAKDPDGNGKADTFGIPADKGFGGLKQFVRFSDPNASLDNNWVKDSSGKQLVYACTTPQTKAALMKLNEIYKEGLIDKEFPVKTAALVKKDFESGKFGVFFGGASGQAHINVRKANPQADLRAFIMYGTDGKPIKGSYNPAPSGEFWMASKKSKNPEALIKLINYRVQKLDIEGDNNYKTPVSGYETWFHAIGPRNVPGDPNALTPVEQIIAKLKGDTSIKLKPGDEEFYNAAKAYRDGVDTKAENWAVYIANNPTDGAQYLKTLLKKEYTIDPFTGTPGKIYVEKMPTLNTMRDEIFTKLIIGAVPMSEFDKFVENWKKLGGDEITKEVNDWYQSQKK